MCKCPGVGCAWGGTVRGGGGQCGNSRARGEASGRQGQIPQGLIGIGRPVSTLRERGALGRFWTEERHRITRIGTRVRQVMHQGGKR